MLETTAGPALQSVASGNEDRPTPKLSAGVFFVRARAHRLKGLFRQTLRAVQEFLNRALRALSADLSPAA